MPGAGRAAALQRAPAWLLASLSEVLQIRTKHTFTWDELPGVLLASAGRPTGTLCWLRTLHGQSTRSQLQQQEQLQLQPQDQDNISDLSGRGRDDVPFIDRAHLTARGGQGGHGAVSYTRVARGRYLAAAGGDGAHGGSVILQACHTLVELRGVPRHAAGGTGGAGGRNCRTGAQGRDRIIRVPPGTIVYELLPWPDAVDVEDGVLARPEECQGAAHTDGALRPGHARPRRQLGELLSHGQELVVAHGGVGGRGNASMPGGKPGAAPSTEATPGTPGAVIDLELQLKLLADVGFVGMPNAGKSSLLAALTAARAKVGAYAFTTVAPQLGTLIFSDDEGEDSGAAGPAGTPLLQRLTLADIPGLVQGAHENRGRGNSFLRHVERVRCMAFVVDLSGGQGGLVPLPAAEQLAVLREEVQRYQPQLAEVPYVVAANKIDACQEPEAAVAALEAATLQPVVPVSALHSAGLHHLKRALRVMVGIAGRR